MNPVRVVIVDDHPLVAEGLERVLQAANWIQVVGRACSLREAEVLLRRQSPDAILLDLRLPDSEGLETIQAVQRYSPQAKLIVLTAYEWGLESSARRLGVHAFLQKEMASDIVIDTLARLFPSRGEAASAGSPLTAREAEVARLAAEGFSNRQIADALFISGNTVKTHLARALQKLGFSHRVELARRWNPRVPNAPGEGASPGPMSF